MLLAAPQTVPADILTARDLAARCRPFETQPLGEAQAEKGLCIGYIHGVIDRDLAAGQPGGLLGCPPYDLSYLEIALGFLRHIDRRPAEAELFAASVLVDAIYAMKACALPASRGE